MPYGSAPDQILSQMARLLPVLLFFLTASALQAQYMETFTGQNGKGLVDAICPVGTTLVIRVCAKTNDPGEQIFIDNISVPQAGVTVICNPPAYSVTGPDYVCNNAAGNTYFAPPGRRRQGKTGR